MQSWGTRSAHIKRDTAREPTKSGVVGLLASALGVSRDDDEKVAALAELKLGVRVDREGLVEVDYQTAQNVPNTAGGGHRTVVSHRYYLSDALFLVVLGASTLRQEALLRRVEIALRVPEWPLYFGRKAFVPARPLLRDASSDALSGWGLSDRPVCEVLHAHPWLETGPSREAVARRFRGSREPIPPPPLRAVQDCATTDQRAEIRPDHPLSFRRGNRRFASRSFKTIDIEFTEELLMAGGARVPEQIDC